MSLLELIGLWFGGLLMGLGFGINIGKSIGRKEKRESNPNILDD